MANQSVSKNLAILTSAQTIAFGNELRRITVSCDTSPCYVVFNTANSTQVPTSASFKLPVGIAWSIEYTGSPFVSVSFLGTAASGTFSVFAY